MFDEISAEIATQILSRAFAPLRCGAEAFDYDHCLRFRVFGANDQPLFRMEKLVRTDFGSVAALEQIINRARSDLTDRGIALAPWQMPAPGSHAT
jgi:hypothetical protein